MTFLASTCRIFDLSLGQMLWSRRSLVLALLAGGPVVLAAAIRIAAWLELGSPRAPRPGGPILYGLMMWLLYIRFIVPALGTFYGTSLVADEVEGRTLTYLFVRPVPRGAVVVGKYLAFLLCASLLVLPSAMFVFFLVVPVREGSLGRSFPSLVADLATLAVGLAAYGALFAFVGARFKRPLAVGLVFAFGWEPAVLFLPGYLKRLTVAYYLQGLVPHAMPDEPTASVLLRVVRESPGLGVSVAGLALISGVSLWLAARAAATREYVLNQ